VTISPNSKTAIVLFNLGGPDSLEAVQPFLFNLFYDPAIFALPNPMRYLLAKFVSKKRTEIASHIYEQMGGRSPILPNTQAQAAALEAALAPHGKAKCFIAMRYWNPRAAEIVRAVKAYAPDQIILLPLYPHYSATTTGSSLKEWHRQANKAGLHTSTHAICCYPTQPNLIAAQARLIRETYEEAKKMGDAPRVLFSAHGLPKKNIAAGDPYQMQVEATTKSVVEALGIPGLDYVNCYQSRVGPLEWIGPSTEDEIKRAGADGVPIVVVPIAFVSEHSETLVELDIEYKELAHTQGVSHYFRVPTVSIEAEFIQALANMCVEKTEGTRPAGFAHCGKAWGKCPCTA
jgi:protoporphyrin/coproporphyrin ferrochelatase